MQKSYFNVLLLTIFIAPLLAPLNFDHSLMVAPDVLKRYVVGLLVLVLCAFRFYLASANQNNRYLLVSQFYLPILLLVVWSFLSLFWASSGYLAVVLLVDWLFAILMFFLVLNSIKTQRQWQQVIKTLIGSALFVSLIVVFQHWFNFDWIRQAIEPAATFGNKNLAGHFFVLIMPLLLIKLALSRHFKSDLFYGFVLLLALSSIFYLNSRATWLAAFLQVFLFVIYVFVSYLKKKKRADKYKIIVFMTVFSLSVLMANISHRGVNNELTHITTRVTSVFNGNDISQWNERINPWLNTLVLIADDYHWLFGVGMNNWSVYYPKYFNRVGLDRTFSEAQQLKRAHNDYLEIFANLGLFALFFILLLCYFVFKCCVFIFKHSRANRDDLLAIVLALFGFAISAFFSFPGKVFLPLFIVMIYLALLANLYFRLCYAPKGIAKISKQQIKEKVLLAIPLPKLWLFVFIALVFLFSYGGYRYLMAENYYNKALQTFNQNQWQQSLQLSKKAYQYNPFQANVLFLLASNYGQTNQLAQAISLYHRLLKSHPFYINALFNLSAAYFNQQDITKGKDYLQKTLTLYPHYIKANLVLTELFWFENKKKQANLQYDKTKEMVFKQHSGYENLGDTALKIKRYQAAIIAFQAAIKARADNVSAMAKLAILLYQLGERKQSLPLMTYVLKIKPNIEQAKQMRQLLKNN